MKTAREFWSKAARREVEACWLWTAGKSSNGYGQVQWRGAKGKAHRIAWLLTHGPVPDGMCILHHCDNPLCVNPSHLFLGSQADNLRDRDQKGRNGHQRKTYCPHGHAYSGDNLYRTLDGHRECRTCSRAAWRKWKNKNCVNVGNRETTPFAIRRA